MSVAEKTRQDLVRCGPGRRAEANQLGRAERTVWLRAGKLSIVQEHARLVQSRLQSNRATPAQIETLDLMFEQGATCLAVSKATGLTMWQTHEQARKRGWRPGLPFYRWRRLQKRREDFATYLAAGGDDVLRQPMRTILRIYRAQEGRIATKTAADVIHAARSMSSMTSSVNQLSGLLAASRRRHEDAYARLAVAEQRILSRGNRVSAYSLHRQSGIRRPTCRELLEQHHQPTAKVSMGIVDGGHDEAA